MYVAPEFSGNTAGEHNQSGSGEETRQRRVGRARERGDVDRETGEFERGRCDSLFLFVPPMGVGNAPIEVVSDLGPWCHSSWSVPLAIGTTQGGDTRFSGNPATKAFAASITTGSITGARSRPSSEQGREANRARIGHSRQSWCRIHEYASAVGCHAVESASTLKSLFAEGLGDASDLVRSAITTTHRVRTEDRGLRTN